MRYVKMILLVGIALSARQAVAGEPDLDWLAGRWCGGDAEQKIEEVWLPEAGGALLGMSRTTRAGKASSFEFLRIAIAGKDVSFHAQPNGGPPTIFTKTAGGEGWIRFGNPAHDFPNLIEYRREGAALHAWISGPGRDGTELRIPFEYRHCD